MSRDHRRMEQLLLALLYRHSCPEPETLGDYYLGRLPPGRRLAVAQHLRHCPHCTEELRSYGEEDEIEATDDLRAWLDQVVSRVRWAVASPDLLPTAARGVPYTQQAYQTEDTQIVVEVSPARAGYRRMDLMGQLQPSDAADMIELWDADMASVVGDQLVEEMGYFEFRQLSQGDYFLCLRADETETWLGPLAVESVST